MKGRQGFRPVRVPKRRVAWRRCVWCGLEQHPRWPHWRHVAGAGWVCVREEPWVRHLVAVEP